MPTPSTPPGRSPKADAPGMKRGSLYASKSALDGFDDAVRKVLETLGGNTPRHVAVSALLEAAAGQADQVARTLAKQQASELAERLDALKRAAE